MNKFLKFSLFFVILILIFFFFFPFSASAAMRVWVDSGSVKIRQTGDPVGSQQNLSLWSAKNEFEPFQIFIFAEGENLSNVDVSLTNFTDGAGNTIDDIYIYKEFYINVVTPSRADYKTGLWPDALLPKVDRYYHEQRNTFPFSVSSGNTQGVWVDVGTTANTPAGIYTAVYTVTAAGKAPTNGTITFTVWNFALPSTPTLQSTIGLGSGYLADGHYGTYQSDSWMYDMMKLYSKALLYHKLTVNTNDNGGWFTEVDTNGHVTSWTNWDAEYGSLMDGTAIPSGPLSGAKLTLTCVEFGNMFSSSYRFSSTTNWVNYLQDWWNHFTTKGWDPINRLYVYAWDEPHGYAMSAYGGTFRGSSTMTDYQVVLTKAQEMNLVNTGGQGTWKNTFTTAPRGTDLSSPPADPGEPGSPYTSLDTTGFYFPLGSTYTYRAPWGDPINNQIARNTYPGYENWATRNHGSYTANEGHNSYCGPNAQGAYCTDNAPDEQLETPPILTRGYFWLQWYYRAHKFLYYDTVERYNTGENYSNPGQPYLDQMSIWGGNGDGTLFYPGVPTKSGRPGLPASTPAIGGTHDIPIESIRLKLWREGIEDREYMEILRNLGALDYADSQADSIFSSLTDPGPYYAIKSDINVLLSARQNMAAKIVELSGGPPPDTTPPAAPSGVTII